MCYSKHITCANTYPAVRIWALGSCDPTALPLTLGRCFLPFFAVPLSCAHQLRTPQIRNKKSFTCRAEHRGKTPSQVALHRTTYRRRLSHSHPHCIHIFSNRSPLMVDHSFPYYPKSFTELLLCPPSPPRTVVWCFKHRSIFFLRFPSQPPPVRQFARHLSEGTPAPTPTALPPLELGRWRCCLTQLTDVRWFVCKARAHARCVHACEREDERHLMLCSVNLCRPRVFTA